MIKNLYISVLILLASTGVWAQDYLQQLTYPIGDTDYLRLTRELSREKIDRSLFSRQSSSEWVRVQDNTHNQYVYNFSVRITADPGWQRIIFADYDRTIHSYGDNPGEVSFDQPRGLCRGRLWFRHYNTWYEYSTPLYVADSNNNRIVELKLRMMVIGSHVGGNDYIVWMEYSREFTGAGGGYSMLNYPVDVVYQETAGGSYYIDDYIWVTDTGNHRIVKIRLSDGQIVEAFGDFGSGENQFIYPTYLGFYNNDPSGILYINDAGNARLVKLETGENTVWSRANTHPGRYLKGISSDEFGDLWAADELNHQIVKYDRYLREVFAYGSYGLGQVSGKINRPIDIGSYYISVINGTAHEKIYGDIVFATEQWSDGSGQAHYRVKPQYVEDSFSYQNIWEPGEGGGPVISKIAAGGPGAYNDDLEYTWKGTRFIFKVTHACWVNVKVYDRWNTNEVVHLANTLMLTGEKSFTWNGKDMAGNTYCDIYAYLRVRVTSVYDPALFYEYSFKFYPCTGMPGSNPELAKIAPDEPLPSVFEVSPNFPNPFNSTTHIRYQLPERGKVTLQIYNVLGQRVKTLVNGNQEAGVYTVAWDGANEHGVSVGSGIYFYRVVFDNNSFQKNFVEKMLVIK